MRSISILRNVLLAPAFVAAAILAMNTATAETIKVPFSFTAAGKNCPAGIYSVDRESGTSSMVTFRNRATSQAFAWELRPGDPGPTASGIVLTFDKNGQTHTLRSIQVDALVTSRLDNTNKKIKSEDRRVARLQGQ